MATGIHFNITGNARGLGRALSLAQRDMNHTIRESQRLGAAMSKNGVGFNAISQGAVLVSSALKAASIAIVGVTIAAGTMATTMVSASAELETAVTRVAAVSGATEGQIKTLTDRAMDLGVQFGITGKSAAEAMNFLAMAGSSAAESMKLVEHSLMIATIGMIDAGRAADITTNIMTGMRLESSEMGHVVDVLANTITSFNVNMTHMGDAFKYAAPLAASMNIEVAELSTAMGMLGNAGLQGEQGGTILRNMMQRLINPTGKSAKIIKQWGVDLSAAAIKADGLAGVIRNLNEAGASEKDLAAVFGVRALSGVLALLDEGAERMEYFTDKMNTQGTAAEINARVMATFEKRVASFKTQLSQASDVMATEWREGLLVGLDLLEDYIESVGITDESLRALGQEAFLYAVEGAVELIEALNVLAHTTAFVADVVMLLYRVLKLLGSSLITVASSAVVILKAAVVGLVTTFQGLIEIMAMIPGAGRLFQESAEAGRRVVRGLVADLGRSMTAVENFTTGSDGAAAVVSDLATKTGEFGRIADRLGPKLDVATQGLMKFRNASMLAFQGKHAKAGEAGQIAINLGLEDNADIAKAIQSVNTKNVGFLDEVQDTMAEGMGVRSALMEVLRNNAIDMTRAEKALLDPSSAPAKKARKAASDVNIPRRSRARKKKKEIDELALVIKALRRQGKERNAIRLETYQAMQKFDAMEFKSAEARRQVLEGIYAKEASDLQAVLDKEVAARKGAQDAINKAMEASRKQALDIAIAEAKAIEERQKAAAKAAEQAKAEHKARQQANAEYLIHQLQSFEALGLQSQLQAILADKEAEASAAFLTAEESKAAAIQRSNEQIMMQVEAFDQLAAKVGDVIGVQLQYERDMLSAETATERKILGQKRQLDYMNMTVSLAPVVAQAFGASAKEQLAAQTAVNAAMGVAALATGNILGALGFGLGALAGLVGLGQSNNLQTTPETIDEDTATENRQQTTQAIIEALKEAGLYQQQRESVTINQTGNDPVAFGNRTRRNRATNARNLRAQRETV